MTQLRSQHERAAPATRADVALADKVLAVCTLLVVLTGIGFAASARSAMWLDEAQAVAIARADLPHLFEYLRQDGSPPLYYLLLHLWMLVFGTGTFAARAMTLALAIVLLVVAGRVAYRVCGRGITGWRAALITAALLAASPMWLRYASETRMYLLLALLVLGLWLALTDVLGGCARPRWALVGVGAATAGIAYSHYWGFFALAVAGVTLLALLPVARFRRPALAAIAAMAVGGLTFLPWLPSMRYQLAHTGTPWSIPYTLQHNFQSIPTEWTGGEGEGARTLLILAIAAMIAGMIAYRKLRLPIGLAVVVVVVAILVSHYRDSAIAPRYALMMLPVFVIGFGAGATLLRSWLRVVAVVAVCVLSLTLGVPQAVFENRSQAGQLGEALRQYAHPGDIVVVCPIEVGPDLLRVAPRDLTYPRFVPTSPLDRVNWVDYVERYDQADPAQFAEKVLAEADGHQVFMVLGFGYLASDRQCAALRDQFTYRTGPLTTIVAQRPKLESAGLLRIDTGRP